METKLADDTPGEPLATGYSCRSQVKRLSSRTSRHPLEVLLEVYQDIQANDLAHCSSKVNHYGYT
jgi:hypothetical protein